MKEALKKGFILGLGAASLTRKKAESTLKGFIAKGKMSKKDGEEMVKNILSVANQERKRLQNVIEKEAKVTAKRWGYISKKEADNLRKKIKSMEKKQRKR